jgi:uncharacterized membrane protein YfcA
MAIEILLLGIVGGVLTTVAGMGGGLLIVAVLGALRGPHEALAITTGALLVSNLHRAAMFRREVDRAVARDFALGAVPGAALGGMVVPGLPGWALSVLLVGATLATLAKSMGWWSIAPGRRALGGAGFGIGVLAATAGGAGVLTAPLFATAGLRGTRYVATIAVGAVALHLGRAIGYGVGGMVARDLLAPTLLLALALVGGNLVGRRLRARLEPELERRLELGTLVACTLFAVAAGVRG